MGAHALRPPSLAIMSASTVPHRKDTSLRKRHRNARSGYGSRPLTLMEKRDNASASELSLPAMCRATTVRPRTTSRSLIRRLARSTWRPDRRRSLRKRRRAKPLSATKPLSARQAIIGARARQRKSLLTCAPNVAKPLSTRAVRIGARDPRAMPLLARQAIIGPRDTPREPSSTLRPLSAPGQSTRGHIGAEAIIGARTPTTRSYGRRATPLSAHVKNDVRGGHDGSPAARQNSPVKTPKRPNGPGRAAHLEMDGVR